MATDSVSNSDESCEPESPAFSEVQIDRTSTVTEGSPMSAHLYGYSRTSSEASAFSDPMYESSVADSRHSLDSPIARSITRSKAVLARLVMKQHGHDADEKWKDQEEIDLELEMMKEKFSKLLLGEDMSGSGKGVCTAVAISNAITNLYATVFGQCYKLEPLSPEKKTMWKAEMKCLLSVCDYIVEFVPLNQDFEDGTHVEVMTSRPRADIYINLPALQKLDTMLLEMLDSFRETEFQYADERALTVRSKNSPSISFRRVVQRKDEKWWLPVPLIPPGGLSEKSKKQLHHKRECANQILKAAMAINSNVLSEMEIPDSYLSNLPKSGKASVGDPIYRYMSSNENFSPEHLLSCINLASEHEALELADQVEAAMYIWQRKACATYSKPSWDMVKDFTADGDKNITLATRAESLLLCLKQRYPGLSQTTLDTCKIQYNKDIGQAILESYSRVLESLAFNTVAWIDDVLCVDGLQNDGTQLHPSQ